MNEKVKAHHLERGAYVYVRQSTPYQVRNNLERKERQYALEGRAQQLGFSKVVVIDEDLGRPVPKSRSGRASADYWRQSARVWPERCLRWKLRDWHVTIATGITWLIYAHSRKHCSSIATASTIRGNSMTVWSSV